MISDYKIKILNVNITTNKEIIFYVYISIFYIIFLELYKL